MAGVDVTRLQVRLIANAVSIDGPDQYLTARLQHRDLLKRRRQVSCESTADGDLFDGAEGSQGIEEAGGEKVAHGDSLGAVVSRP